MQDETTDKILRAAEELFAANGFDSTSLRTITARAGVNLASVHYHFGSKEGLLKEIFSRRLVFLNQERQRRITLLPACKGNQAASLEALLEAFIGPELELSQDVRGGGAHFARLLGRAYMEPPAALKDAFSAQYAEVLASFKVALVQVLPDVPRVELYWRLHFTLGVVAYAMSGNDFASIVPGYEHHNINQSQTLLQRLIPFLAAGLSAPVPADLSDQENLRLQAGAGA